LAPTTGIFFFFSFFANFFFRFSVFLRRRAALPSPHNIQSGAAPSCLPDRFFFFFRIPPPLGVLFIGLAFFLFPPLRKVRVSLFFFFFLKARRLFFFFFFFFFFYASIAFPSPNKWELSVFLPFARRPPFFSPRFRPGTVFWAGPDPLPSREGWVVPFFRIRCMIGKLLSPLFLRLSLFALIFSRPC